MYDIDHGAEELIDSLQYVVLQPLLYGFMVEGLFHVVEPRDKVDELIGELAY